MISNIVPVSVRSLLIFCYFLMFVCGLSCGDAPSKKQEDPTVSPKSETTEEASSTKKILFFGNSLTAGMGLDPNEAFPAVIQKKLDSLALPYEVINAGLSGETTAAGKSRISWVLQQDVEIFVLELGANDGLRGIPLEETRKNLQDIIDFVRQQNQETKIVLTGMQMHPNMGDAYTTAFKNIFPELAAANGLYLVPFLLENVGGIPELNQADGIHPTVEGQRILAENVWEVLEGLVGE
ncbi:arylesterase [Arenibacter sp. GZD96]|uniref:arylesterase n=1 Tax=Aurantibrevibacter litoralis TaxID=3106030 RepID=UPI002AFE5A9C|nr:arylesterase [Arenibacter sp. GZD-96]MEA1785815.1 arylesterase [Arenibacter sp. GZD-96]